MEISPQERAQALYDREKVREMLATEGAQIVARKAMMLVDQYKALQLKTSPFKHPELIVKYQQFSYLVEVEIPNLLNAMINYEEEKKFSIWEWLKKVLKK